MSDTPAICRTCRWWHKTQQHLGECRRFPPPRGMPPSTNSAFWCGECEAKEPAQEDG